MGVTVYLQLSTVLPILIGFIASCHCLWNCKDDENRFEHITNTHQDEAPENLGTAWIGKNASNIQLRSYYSDVRSLLQAVNTSLPYASPTSKFELLTWRNFTWISAHNPGVQGFFIFTADMCKVMGFALCTFEINGQYASELPVNYTYFNELAPTAKLGMYVSTWEARRVKFPRPHFSCTNIQLLPKDPAGLAEAEICVYVLEKDGQYAISVPKEVRQLEFSEQFRRFFTVTQKRVQSGITLLDSSEDGIIANSSCDMSLKVFTRKDSPFYIKTSRTTTVAKLLLDMNRIFHTAPVKVEANCTRYDDRCSLLINDETGRYDVRIDKHLQALMGFRRTNFTANGLYVADDPVNRTVLSTIGDGKSLSVTLVDRGTKTIHIPQSFETPNSQFLQEISLHVFRFSRRIVVSRRSDHYELKIFDPSIQISFNTCLRNFLEMSTNFVASYPVTTVPLTTPGTRCPTLTSNPAATSDATVEFSKKRVGGTSSINAPAGTSTTWERLSKDEDLKTCNLIINEVLPTKQFEERYSNTQFIELVLRCGRYTTLKPDLNLDRYVLLIIDIGGYHNGNSIVPTTVFSAYLKRMPLHTNKVAENLLDEHYGIVGTSDLGVAVLDITSNEVRHIQTRTVGNANAIPKEQEHPVAVVLLRMKRNEVRLASTLTLFPPNKDNEVRVKEPSDSDLQVIQERVVDIFVYGRTCNPIHNDILKKMYIGVPSDCADMVYTSQTQIPFPQQQPQQTYSRCDDGNKPVFVHAFRDQDATPGQVNHCPREIEMDYVFDLKNKVLQRTAQWMILNVWRSIYRAQVDPTILHGTPRVVAARLAGVSADQISTVNSRRRNNAIMTPKKKARRQCPVQVQIDSFDRDWIKRTIIASYDRGSATTAFALYKNFLAYKLDEYNSALAKHNEDPNRYPKPTIFSCSYPTFLRVLHVMGYKNGKINNRAGIVQRPDLISWRGKYLRKKRKNAALKENAKPLVYIDETWIDRNGRVARGWFPAKCKSFKEMAPYSYGSDRVGKGPRLIVLAAMTEYEVIKDSVLVYKVSASKADGDYHGNVNAEAFMKWYDKLLAYLDKTGKKYIIVMDNASYHTVRQAPKKSENKDAIFTWLKSKVDEGKLHMNLPSDVTKIRKWELEEKLDSALKEPAILTDLYEVDRVTKDHGHEVLRLPPYNCDLNPIELVWKDIKHNVRKLNVKNIDVPQDPASTRAGGSSDAVESMDVDELTGEEATVTNALGTGEVDGGETPKIMKELDKLVLVVQKELENYNPELAKKHVAHVKHVEEQYWKEDGFVDDHLHSLVIINTADDDDEDDEDDDDNVDGDVGSHVDTVIDDVAAGRDIVEIGGDMTLWDCDWSHDIFASELEIGRYMADGATSRRRGNFFGRRINMCPIDTTE